MLHLVESGVHLSSTFSPLGRDLRIELSSFRLEALVGVVALYRSPGGVLLHARSHLLIADGNLFVLLDFLMDLLVLLLDLGLTRGQNLTSFR